MTPALRSLWLAVFAATWHRSTPRAIGLVTDEQRAINCMAQADRAVDAVRGLVRDIPGGRASPSRYAGEVLE